MVDGPRVVAVGDTNDARGEIGPAGPDLPVELRAFDGGHRKIAEDMVEPRPLSKHKRFGAMGYGRYLVAVGREDIGDERAHLASGFDHQDTRWHGGRSLYVFLRRVELCHEPSGSCVTTG